ncbi:MAG TPA: OmpA family protein [Ohtaekwangia sp.]|nr:OmpA family protein [Ohtaekwangia sp.]
MHHVIRFVFLFSLQVTCFPAVSQNLVPNSGFESYLSCPGNFSQDPGEFRISDWYSANSGTPDYFNECSRGEADVPHNWAGVSSPYQGKGYVGIFMWMDSDNDYREYLACKLHTPLIADSVYVITFHYKLSSYSMYAIDRIGMVISDTVIRVKHDQAMQFSPTLQTVQDTALTQQTGYWEKAQYEYLARGGEQFITIGNFDDNIRTKHYRIQHRVIQQEMLANSAYYFVDDVRVLAKYTPDTLVIPVKPFGDERIELNKRYVLENIQFEFNSYKLMQASKDELDKVVFSMKTHPHYKVILSGHTDDVGDDRYNMALSANRAKSAALYLMSQGIASIRIESRGYGKAQPLLSGSSEEIRQKNRRVEIMFIQ